MRGQIRKELLFVVECKKCGNEEVLDYSQPPHTKKQAEAQAREQGWKKVQGLWFCIDCKPWAKLWLQGKLMEE